MDPCCGKCSLVIDVYADLYTVCEGMCAKSFHAKCVDLTEANLCALSSNIIWLCNPCMKVFCRMRERNSTDVATNTDTPPRSVVEDLNELRNTVEDIVCTLSKIVQKPNFATPHHCSTPISSLNLFDGTNEIGCTTKRDESLESTTDMPDDDVFSLYLTNIHKCVTKDDISSMVAQQLGAPLSNCLDVVKLMPKSRNINTLDYVSFKVVLDKRWKIIAMTAATWPKGVKFREFVSRLNETWKPA